MFDNPKNIMPLNAEGLRHGQHVVYHKNDILWYRENWINGLNHGPFESYNQDCSPICKCTYDMGEYVGYYCRYDIKDSRFYAR